MLHKLTLLKTSHGVPQRPNLKRFHSQLLARNLSSLLIANKSSETHPQTLYSLTNCSILYSPLSNKRAGWNKQAGGKFFEL